MYCDYVPRLGALETTLTKLALLFQYIFLCFYGAYSLAVKIHAWFKCLKHIYRRAGMAVGLLWITVGALGGNRVSILKCIFSFSNSAEAVLGSG